MRKLNFTQKNYHQDSVCAGLVVLQTDEVVESEVRFWLPDAVTLYHARIANDDAINESSLQAMHKAIPAVCSMFPTYAPLQVIAYCCTSGATMIGEQQVEDAVQSIWPTVAVTNPLSAIKARLSKLNASNIGLLTPYIPSVSTAMSDHLQQHGFNVVSAASFYEEQDNVVCRISPNSIEAAAKQIAAQAHCDAIFASCTNLRTQTILASLSNELGIPVISSNAALAWHIMELAQIEHAQSEH